MSRPQPGLSTRPAARGTADLWFGLLAGHLAWTAQLLLSYFVVSLACLPRPAGFQIPGVDGFQFVLFALTLLPAAVALAATVIAFGAWRAAGVGLQVEGGEPTGWRGFLGLFGALLSGLFVAVILLTGVSLLYLEPCRS